MIERESLFNLVEPTSYLRLVGRVFYFSECYIDIEKNRETPPQPLSFGLSVVGFFIGEKVVPPYTCPTSQLVGDLNHSNDPKAH